MHRSEYGDLAAFLTVAEEGSFTRAAAKLGTSQSALSHTVRRLEERLGLRILSRTTRNISMTEAGAKLYAALAPAFDDIRGSLAALDENGPKCLRKPKVASWPSWAALGHLGLFKHFRASHPNSAIRSVTLVNFSNSQHRH